MIDLIKAQRQILESAHPLGHESVPILDGLKRVLSQNIAVVEDFPAADISAMDGYALRHRSLLGVTRQNPVHLRIIGESPAGRPCGARVGDAEAVRIMTGGLVPEGADTVVKIEDATEDGGYVICTTDPGRGDGIRFRGESLRSGDIALRAGEVITPLVVGVLATLRRAYVVVHRRPMVAILATGDELTDFHEPPVPGKAMCSNLYALAAQVLEAGALPLCMGIVPDNLTALESTLREALRADVIITSGGTSRGKYDLVRKAFATLGIKMRFSTIFVKPGKPTLFGTIGEHLVFGLPGNPSATMLSYEQFIKPALLRMLGYPPLSPAAADRPSASEGNGVFSRVDSFARGGNGNAAHRRASLVTLNTNRPQNEQGIDRHPSTTRRMGGDKQ